MKLMNIINEIRLSISQQIKYIKENIEDIDDEFARNLGYDKDDYNLKYFDLKDKENTEDLYNTIKTIIDAQNKNYKNNFIRHGRSN